MKNVTAKIRSGKRTPVLKNDDTLVQTSVIKSNFEEEAQSSLDKTLLKENSKDDQKSFRIP